MPVTEELKILITTNASKSVQDMNRLKRSTKDTTTGFKSMAKTLIGAGGVAAGLLAVKRLVIDNARESIKFAAAMEKQTVAFKVMLKSSARAETLMKQIQTFSARTPFMLQPLTDVAQVLIASGTAAAEVTQQLQDLGNAAGGNSEKLARLGNAFAKLQNKGKASLEELNMFMEAGVPILAALQEQFGATKEEMSKLITAGKVGFDDVNQALQDLTRGEGQFAGMLLEQSKTLSGVMSTLKGEIQLAGAALAQDFLPFLKDVAIVLTKIVGTIRARANLGATLDSASAIVSGPRAAFQSGKDAQLQLDEAIARLSSLEVAEDEAQRVRQARLQPIRTVAAGGSLREDPMMKKLGTMRQLEQFITGLQLAQNREERVIALAEAALLASPAGAAGAAGAAGKGKAQPFSYVALNTAADSLMGLFTHRINATLGTLPSIIGPGGYGGGASTPGMQALILGQMMGNAPQLYGAAAGGFGGGLPGGVPGVGSPYRGINPDFSGFKAGAGAAAVRMGGIPTPRGMPSFGFGGQQGEDDNQQAARLNAEAIAAAHQKAAFWMGEQDKILAQLSDVMKDSLIPAMETMGRVWVESGSALKGVVAGVKNLAAAVLRALPEILMQLAIQQVPGSPQQIGLIAAALGTAFFGGALGANKSQVSNAGGGTGNTIIINNAGSLISQEDLVAQIEGVSRKAS